MMLGTKNTSVHRRKTLEKNTYSVLVSSTHTRKGIDFYVRVSKIKTLKRQRS